MATRFFCDGCDREIGNGYEAKVTASSKSMTLVNFDGHLCEGCQRHVKEVADPKKWPRAIKPIRLSDGPLKAEVADGQRNYLANR